MCKPMKQRDLIRVLENAGFIMIRTGEHKVFQYGSITTCVPHSKTVSSGMVHQAFKAIKLSKQVQNQSLQKVA